MILNLFKLFANYFVTGMFSVGGGLATLPFLYDMSDRTGWFTYQELNNMVAISECTPGAIGANTATYVGFHVASFPGIIAANLGLVMPGILLILLIAKFLDQFRNNPLVDRTFNGLRPASVGLISAAAVSVLRITMLNEEMMQSAKSFVSWIDYRAVILAVVLFVLMKKFKDVHPAAFLGASAVVGAVFSFAE